MTPCGCGSCVTINIGKTTFSFEGSILPSGDVAGTYCGPEGTPVRLFAGHEALIKPGLIEDIQAGGLSTLNGSRYLLLELWNQSQLPEVERVIFELRTFGITPILAHLERYRVFQKEPERLASLLRQGVLAQITASSLVGMQGRTAQRSNATKQGLVRCMFRTHEELGSMLLSSSSPPLKQVQEATNWFVPPMLANGQELLALLARHRRAGGRPSTPPLHGDRCG